MEIYRMRPDVPLTPERIRRYIERHAPEEARRRRLKRYYRGEHDILSRTFGDPSKPNNRIVNPYAQYITDIIVGYFLGEPVKYSSADEALLGEINQIFNYNDEAAENAELATDASIMGAAYEMLYLDGDRMVRFKRLDGETCIPIYDDTVEEELLWFIRYYDMTVDVLSGSRTRFVEVYGRESVEFYAIDAGQMTLVERRPHAFGLVPVAVFDNNRERLGDFEAVIPLIDAYDKLESDAVNDMEYFADAYLMLTGMDGTDANDIAAMKSQRVMLVPTGGDARWLTKEAGGESTDALKARIDRSIHKFSKCPAMTDEDFAANASGVAMKYKLLGLEDLTAKKERAFKRGLQRRLELICNVLAVLRSSYDYRAVEIAFSRNLPSNLSEMADVVGKLGDLLSEKARLDLLPIDVDYEADREQREKEREAGYIDYGEQLLAAQSRALAGEGGEAGGQLRPADAQGVS